MSVTENGILTMPSIHAGGPMLLVGASKSGVASDRFYRRLIATADSRFDDRLADLRGDKRR